jgi:DNA polymerase III psi subunit
MPLPLTDAIAVNRCPCRNARAESELSLLQSEPVCAISLSMTSEVQTYLQYAKDNLGISSILLPEIAEAVPEDFKALFFLEVSVHQTPEDEDMQLLQKIIEALQLNFSQVAILSGSLGDLAESLPQTRINGPIFCFHHETLQFVKNNFPHYDSFELPALAKMRATPELKRQAWKTLKSSLQIS